MCGFESYVTGPFETLGAAWLPRFSVGLRLRLNRRGSAVLSSPLHRLVSAVHGCGCYLVSLEVSQRALDFRPGVVAKTRLAECDG